MKSWSLIPDEGKYNTYIIDTDYDGWALLMHCAEKNRHSRYLSALMMSRTPTVGHNVKAFLREKLPKYDIDLDFFFEVRHDNCQGGITSMIDYYENFLKDKQEEIGNVEVTGGEWDGWRWISC